MITPVREMIVKKLDRITPTVEIVHPTEGNQETKMKMYLRVGTTLSDAENEYVVREMEHKNTHSQFPSSYLVECVYGPNKGKVRWVSAALAIQYQGEWKE